LAYQGVKAQTLSGIIQCYLLAIPFFRNTLLGNLFYVTVFFGAYEIAKVWIEKRFKSTEAELVSI